MANSGFYQRYWKDIVEMKSNPLVTIITPSFNQGQFVEETIKSVLCQTYSNIEYIFVDGGSTDRTMQIVDSYKDDIDIIIHEKDEGQADAINKGLKLAKGELVGWINSDDVLYPECVEKIVEVYSKNTDGAIYYSANLDWIDVDGNILNKYTVKIPNRDYLLNENYVIIQPGSFYPLRLIRELEFLETKNYYCMDLALWLDLLKHGKIYYLDSNESLSAFRIHEGSKTDTGKTEFLLNIRQVLLERGSKWYSKNIILRIYIYSIKSKIKKWLALN